MVYVSTQIKEKLKDFYSASEIRNFTMIIWCDIFGREALDIYLGKDNDLSEDEETELNNIIERLLKHEPIQYIRGRANFCGSTYYVAPGVLIPRPETEELVELIVKENNCNKPTILDIGTGSGCIAISLALQIPNSDVTAWDVSDIALEIAEKNSKRLTANVNFELKNVLTFLPESEDGIFDIIVSNPPYITPQEKHEMEKNVLDWEPNLALFVPQDDPLIFYNKIAQLGLKLLHKGGKLYFEINRAYGHETIQMLLDMGYENPIILKDISKNDRIVTANKKTE